MKIVHVLSALTIADHIVLPGTFELDCKAILVRQSGTLGSFRVGKGFGEVCIELLEDRARGQGFAARARERTLAMFELKILKNTSAALIRTLSGQPRDQ